MAFFVCSSRSLFISLNNSFAYRFACLGTAFLACFFRLAIALMCVPSTKWFPCPDTLPQLPLSAPSGTHTPPWRGETDAWSSIVLTIQILYKFIDLFEVDCCVDFPQQVILWNHIFQTYQFKLSSIFCVLYQHFYHPFRLYDISSLYTRKRPPFGDLFRQAERTFVPEETKALCGPMVFISVAGGGCRG